MNSYGLVGHPLSHSLSPFIHEILFQQADFSGEYTLYDIAPDDLQAAFPSLLKTLGGCNVTVPYKQQVLPFLLRLEGKAALYQTVNTVAVKDGEAVGYNTDADGFLGALADAGIPLRGRVCLLGAGGAATVFAMEAALAGCDVCLYHPRNVQSAAQLQARVRTIVPTASVTVADCQPDGEFDLLVNATPVGMSPHPDACPAPDALITRSAAVFDAVYNPRRTLLVQKAQANGANIADGMAMLVRQAALAQTIWYGAAFDDDTIHALVEACHAQLAKREAL